MRKTELFRLTKGLLCVLAGIVLLAHCGGEDPECVRSTLRVILDDDLAALVQDIPSGSRADSCYHVVTDYQTYPQGSYRIRAQVSFVFLAGNIATVIRKYRYHAESGLWERYHNEYRLTHDANNQ